MLSVSRARSALVIALVSTLVLSGCLSAVPLPDRGEIGVQAATSSSSADARVEGNTSGAWPTFEGNQHRDGVQAAAGDALPSSYEVAWHQGAESMGANLSIWYPSLLATDLVGDDDRELLLVAGDELFAVGHEGQVTWNRSYDVFDLAVPAVRDLTGDDEPEVVFLTGQGAVLHIVDAGDGSVLYREDLGDTYNVKPVLADVAGNETAEVLFPDEGNVLRAASLVREPNRTRLPLVPNPGPPAVDPAEGSHWALQDRWRTTIGEGGGITEILPAWSDKRSDAFLVSTSRIRGDNSDEENFDGSLALVARDGTVRWNRTYPHAVEVRNTADLHPAPGPEIGLRLSENGPFERFRLLDQDGDRLCSLSQDAPLYDSGLVAQLDGTGPREVVLADHEEDALIAWSGCSRAWNRTPGHNGEWQGADGPVAADLDGDGALEIIFARAGGRVHVLDERGRTLETIQLEPEPPQKDSARQVSVADLDRDGTLEIAVTYYSGDLYLLDVPSR